MRLIPREVSYRYDNFNTQIGLLPQREYYNVTMPDYVAITYDFIVWTSYIEQMNKIVERVVYSDGAYWGDPDKMKFRTSVDTFTDATEVSDVETSMFKASLYSPCGISLSSKSLFILDFKNSRLNSGIFY